MYSSMQYGVSTEFENEVHIRTFTCREVKFIVTKSGKSIHCMHDIKNVSKVLTILLNSHHASKIIDRPICDVLFTAVAQ